MGPIEQLEQVVPVVEGIVDRIGVEQLTAPTPCDQFTVHDVLDHMIVLGGGFAHLFRGDEPRDEPPPPVYGRVPATELRRALDDLLDAVRSDGAMQRVLATPIGELDGETFARVVAFDGLVHGWDLAVATGQRCAVPDEVVAEIASFADVALTDELRSTGMFATATVAPADAAPIERLAAFSGRTVEPRWRRTGGGRHVRASELPVKIDVPGALARQLVGFGDVPATTMAAEHFTLAAGTDIAPLLVGLDGDTCHAPHWGHLVSGEVVVTYLDGVEDTCRGGELFHWPPGHRVRVVEDAEVVLFSPADQHAAVLDHMLERLGAG